MKMDGPGPRSQNEYSVRTTKRLLSIYYLISLHLVAVYFVVDRISQMYTIQARVQYETGLAPTPATEISPSRSPSEPDVNVMPPQDAENGSVTPLPSGLIIPVQGVKQEQLTDSYSDARSAGRVHDAIDIMAPAGTPVLAAADGSIANFFDSKAGGTTVYELSTDSKLMFYYAHLQKRADGLNVGDVVKQGRVIGFVGDTGNAGAGNYHLHFAISAVADPKRFWDGTPINPYPLLKR
jgi:peptidoglycan LD-endopeptidase LytH